MTSGESSDDNFVLINLTAAMIRFKSLPNSSKRTECFKEIQALLRNQSGSPDRVPGVKAWDAVMLCKVVGLRLTQS